MQIWNSLHPAVQTVNIGLKSHLNTQTKLSVITTVIAEELLLLQQFNGLFSRTTWISRYQKGTTSLDLNDARDDGVLLGWQWLASTGPHANNLHLAPDR